MDVGDRCGPPTRRWELEASNPDRVEIGSEREHVIGMCHLIIKRCLD